MLTWALLDSARSDVREQRNGTWRELAKLVTAHEVSDDKDGAAWMPATIEPGRRIADRVTQWDTLPIDVEAKAEKQAGGCKRVVGPMPPTVQELANRLRNLGWASALATSFSHEMPIEGGSLGPRYRVVVALSRPLTTSEIRPLGLYVGSLLDLLECMDRTCLDAARLFYLPRCTADRLHLAESCIIDGRPLDVDALLNQRASAERIRLCGTVRPNALTSSSPDALRPEQSSPPSIDLPSVIDEFNLRHSAAQVLEANGYCPCGPDRWIWPGSTSGEPGVVRLPESGRIYSHHDNDPLRGDAQHAHDAFSVWCTLEFRGDTKLAVREAARKMGFEAPRARSESKAGLGERELKAYELPPLTQEPYEHPLARTIEFGDVPVAPRWIIPGVIAHGVVVIAGAHGVGKTTAILPLALTAAGLHAEGDSLAPKHWRHVCYVTEDTDQAKRILAGVIGHGELGLNLATVKDRFHLIEACRLSPEHVAKVSKDYRQKYTRAIDGVDVLPLVVFDTMAAVLEVEDENNNSEASRVMAILKQDFMNLPVWLVGHVAKQNLGRSDSDGLSLRGGSAFEADAHQILYLVKAKEGQRSLCRGKTRFEANWSNLAIESRSATAPAQDEFGDPEEVAMRWSRISPGGRNNSETRKQSEQAAEQAKKNDLLKEIWLAVDQAWRAESPLNRQGVISKVKRQRQVITNSIDELLVNGWLQEIPVPAHLRRNPKQSSFLVALSDEERSEWMRTRELPEAKRQVPASWTKAADRPGAILPRPSVPNPFIPLSKSICGTDGRGTESPRPSVHSQSPEAATEHTRTHGNVRIDAASEARVCRVAQTGEFA